MRRFFVKNLLFVLAVNLLVKPVWIFMIDRTVQNRVGHTNYGTYQALFNLGIIFQIILDFGLSYYNTRVIAQNPRKLRALFPVLLSARLLLIVVYGIIVSVLGLIVGYTPYELALLGGILLIQVLNSLIQFLRSNISSLHKFKADGLLSVTDRLIMIIVCGFLLAYPATASGFKIEWFVIAQVFSYSIAVIAGFIMLKSISRVRLAFSLNFKEILAIVKSSLPYASLVFLMAVHTRVDTVLLERLTENGKMQAGVYAAAYRLLDVGNMFGLMFAGMLLPLFGRMLVEKQDVHPIIKLCVDLMLPVAFTISVAAIYFGQNVMEVLYLESTLDDGKIFALLMASFPAYCMMYVYSTLLTANGNLKLLNKIALTGVLINLAANFVLIPRFGAIGAAFSAFMTQSILALCFMVFSEKHLQLQKNIKRITAHLSFLVLVFLLGYFCLFLPTKWIVQMAFFGTSSLALIFIFRFVSWRSIQNLMSNR